MLFAKWIGDSQLSGGGQKVVYKGDVVEVHARGANRTEFVCRGCRHDGYFWGNEFDLEWCSPINAEDVVHDFSRSS